MKQVIRNEEMVDYTEEESRILDIMYDTCPLPVKNEGWYYDFVGEKVMVFIPYKGKLIPAFSPICIEGKSSRDIELGETEDWIHFSFLNKVWNFSGFYSDALKSSKALKYALEEVELDHNDVVSDGFEISVLGSKVLLEYINTLILKELPNGYMFEHRNPYTK